MNGSYVPPSDPLDALAEARAELRSVTDDEEDTGVTNLPSDAPAKLRWSLAALFSLPPGGRTAVLLLTVVCLTALFWRFGPAVVSLFYKP